MTAIVSYAGVFTSSQGGLHRRTAGGGRSEPRLRATRPQARRRRGRGPGRAHPTRGGSRIGRRPPSYRIASCRTPARASRTRLLVPHLHRDGPSRLTATELARQITEPPPQQLAHSEIPLFLRERGEVARSPICPDRQALLVQVFETPRDIIRQAAMLYVRFSLSLRNIEDLLYEGEIDLCNHAAQFWRSRLRPTFATESLKR